jgi:hypothetical protein
MIDYHVSKPGLQLPPVDEARLLDYVVGSNGVFARGRRPGLEVSMPVSFSFQPVRGLSSVASYVQWGYPRVPVQLLEAMLIISRQVCEPAPREALFHLSFAPEQMRRESARESAPCTGHSACSGGWHVEYPDQKASRDRVVPAQTGVGSSTERAVIEVHSHHSMKAEFSFEDNRDEVQGFRVYAVLGSLFSCAEIRSRVGLFGHFLEYPAAEFFELPDGLRDCVGWLQNGG